MSWNLLDKPLALFPELLSEGTSRYVVLGKHMGDLDEDGNPGGQLIYRFPNGFAASVVRYSWAYEGSRSGTYGATAGLYEVAVGQYLGEGLDDWQMVKTALTPGDAVMGWQSPAEVERFLLAVKDLDESDIEVQS